MTENNLIPLLRFSATRVREHIRCKVESSTQSSAIDEDIKFESCFLESCLLVDDDPHVKNITLKQNANTSKRRVACHAQGGC